MSEEEIPAERECTHPDCKKVKPLEEFHRNKSKPYGRQTWCKECQKRDQRKRYRYDEGFRERQLEKRRINYLGKKVKKWWDVENREIIEA